MPQKRISICKSRSVVSRRGIVSEASGDVALAAEYALTLYMFFSSYCFLLFCSESDLVLFPVTFTFGHVMPLKDRSFFQVLQGTFPPVS